jgi:ferric-dicitrate binding protein FerR (iron transport regulator)
MALDVKEIVDEVDARYGKKGKRYAQRYAKHAKKLERKLEKSVQRLPVDTPLDRHRRHRTARRAGRGVLALIVVGAAAAYVAWRALRDDRSFDDAQPTEAGPAPDAFGTAVDRGEPLAVTSP